MHKILHQLSWFSQKLFRRQWLTEKIIWRRRLWQRLRGLLLGCSWRKVGRLGAPVFKA